MSMLKALADWSPFVEALREFMGGDFICHRSQNSWYGEVMVMHHKGEAKARSYFFNDDRDEVYFDMLTVDFGNRNKRLATKLREGHIAAADRCGLESYLFCEGDSWQRRWYESKGYEFYKDYNLDFTTGLVWLRRPAYGFVGKP